ncbi:hypothetical protein HYU07_02510 [Candidatus Woesearchaeota archaeon]|nr:hypothetical protein [Candidatus Woesearchaeota archaeon]
METIDDVLKLKKVGELEKSDFPSCFPDSGTYGCKILDAKKYLKEIIKESKGLDVESVILLASPIHSHMVIYELGCGLQIVLPFDKEKETLTSSKKVVPNYSGFYDCISLQKGRLIDGELKIEEIFGGTRKLKRRLIRHLKRYQSMPPLIENDRWLRGRRLGGYLIKEVSDKNAGCYRDISYHTSAEKVIRAGDLYSSLNYRVKTGEEISKAKYLEINYKVTIQEKDIEVDIHIEDKCSNASISFGRKDPVAPTSVAFNNEGEIFHYHFPQPMKGKDITLDKAHYQKILSTIEDGQVLGLGQIMILVELEMKSPHQKLDYVASIKNIIETASNPASLQQFKPLIFRD